MRDGRIFRGKELIFGGGLLALLSLVLFVACANVAQLRLAQAEARRKEIAVRVALGAGGRTIARQLLLETSLIAIPGAALGVLLAHVLLAKAVQVLTVGRTFLDPGVRLDSRVLAFTVVATLLSVLIAGMPSARLASRLGVSEILKTAQGGTGSYTRWRQIALMVGQTAICVALLGTTLLFLQSLHNAAAIRPGFEPDKKLLLVNAIRGLDLPRTTWCEQASERLAAIAGVRAATFARRVPLSGSGGGAMARVEMPGQQPRAVKYNNVAGNYFSVMGTRVLGGRGIDSNDRQRTQPVIVVSQTFARQFLPDRNPTGESVRINGKLWQVVGLAEDAPSIWLHETPEPYIYFAYAQMPSDDVTFMIQTAGEPAAIGRSVINEIRRFDPRAMLYGIKTLRQHMDGALAADRLMSTTTSTLGLVSIALMAAGLFGVLQYSVAQRTRELGLRVAVGATPGRIHCLILGSALRIAAFGIPTGLVLLAGLAWMVRSAVVGVKPWDPALYAATAVAVVAIMIGAAWVPAIRAIRIQPMDALRAE